MKTKFNVYGEIYEVEIKAKNIKNLNASPKATEMVCQWLETRLWEASHENIGMAYEEITTCASNLHIVNKHYKKLNN